MIWCTLWINIFFSPAASAALFEPNPANFGALQAAPSNCDDCFSGPVLFPGAGQSLNFFGTNYTGLFVSSNGYVTFGAGSGNFTPAPLNIQTVAPMIAAVYTDLDSGSDATSQVFVNTATPGQIVVTWANMGHFPEDYSVRSTFQLVVRSDQFPLPPGENRIGFFYGTITDSDTAAGGFGDGLAAVNPGESALFFGAATGLNNAAVSWYGFGPAGVPVAGPTAGIFSVPTLTDSMLLFVALSVLLAGAIQMRTGNLKRCAHR